MTVYWHSAADKATGSPLWSWGRRFFIHWGDDDRKSAHLDAYWRSAHRHGLGGYLRFDGPGAETPIDVAVFAGRTALFAGTSVGRRLCRVLRLPEPGGSRQIGAQLRGPDGVRAHLAHWSLSWQVWTDPEHTVRPTKYVIDREGLSRWYLARRGYVHPVGDILDRALGKQVCATETSDPVPATVHLQDGAWPVTVKLETRTWKRARSPRVVTSRSAWVDVVPTSDGGRGGPPNGRVKYGSDDGLWGCGTRELTEREATDPGKWVAVGVGRFTEAILKDRAEYGWNARVPHGETLQDEGQHR